MKKWFSEFWKLGLITVGGILGSITAGLMRYGGNVLVPSDVGFAYVSFGLTGSFVFAFYHVRGLSNTITAAVCVSALQFVASVSYIPVVNSAIWSFGVNLSVVLLAFLFERKLATFKQLKFAVVGVVYGALFVLLTLLVAVVTNVGSMPAEVFRENFLDGLLIGIGLGLGVEVAESFIHSAALKH